MLFQCLLHSGGQVTSAQSPFCSAGFPLVLIKCPSRVCHWHCLFRLPTSVDPSWPLLYCSVPLRLRLGQPIHVLRQHWSASTNCNGHGSFSEDHKYPMKSLPHHDSLQCLQSMFCCSCRMSHFHESWPYPTLEMLNFDDTTSRTPTLITSQGASQLNVLTWNVWSVWHFKESVFERVSEAKLYFDKALINRMNVQIASKIFSKISGVTIWVRELINNY